MPRIINRIGHVKRRRKKMSEYYFDEDEVPGGILPIGYVAAGFSLFVCIIYFAVVYFVTREPTPVDDDSIKLSPLSVKDQQEIIKYLRSNIFTDLPTLIANSTLTCSYNPALREFLTQLSAACLLVLKTSNGLEGPEILPPFDPETYKSLAGGISPDAAEAVMKSFNVAVPSSGVVKNWTDFIPIIAGPKPLKQKDALRPACLMCGASVANKRCPRCKSVWYCTVACARQDMARHKDECLRFSGGSASRSYDSPYPEGNTGGMEDGGIRRRIQNMRQNKATAPRPDGSGVF